MNNRCAMVNRTKLIINALMYFLLLSSCHDDQDKANFVLTYPDYFPKPYYQSAKNPLTQEGFELGRSLFFDPILSNDDAVSCASCHHQAFAFADKNIRFSQGIDNRVGNRNSPPIFNLAWQPIFMWDGGINHLEVMPLAPITNELEMGASLSNIVSKLNHHASYKKRFQSVFGRDTIDSQKLFFALAQYMSYLVSCDSKYDQFRQGKISFSADELDGYQIFMRKCANCHQEPLFTDFSLRNNGLSSDGKDLGYGRITLIESDNDKFKVPTLRNIALTAPYMHDGRFLTLRQVLDHYSNGVQSFSNLDPFLSNKDRIGIDLTDNEKEKLLLFLNTLTDNTFITNHLYSEL